MELILWNVSLKIGFDGVIIKIVFWNYIHDLFKIYKIKIKVDNYKSKSIYIFIALLSLSLILFTL